MSWFDASGIANLAKSALKEAQKTIDKALDIKEEEQKRIETPPHGDVNAAVGGDNADFFAEWGLKNDEGKLVVGSEKSPAPVPAPGPAPIAKDKPAVTTSAIWGSFAGSFFETTDGPVASAGVEPISEASLPAPGGVPSTTTSPQHRSSRSKDSATKTSPHSSTVRETANRGSIDDDRPLLSPRRMADSYESFKGLVSLGLGESNDAINEESFSNSQLIVELDDDVVRGDGDDGRRQSLGNRVGTVFGTDHIADTIRGDESRVQRRRSSDETGSEDSKKIPAVRRRELNSAGRGVANRISVISSESDKKSSESVEVLGSRSSPGTDCTTTPESDLNSFCNSTCSSTRIHSESVEILPDCSSLTASPSSVEILGEWKSESSPFLSPVEAGDVATFRSLPADDDDPQPQDEIRDDSKTITQDFADKDNTPVLGSSLGMAIASGAATPATIRPTGGSETDNEDASPESVEVIPEIDESDEPSLAEDSYTSASESTVLLTVVEGASHQQLLADRGKPKLGDLADRGSKMHDSCPDTRQNVTRSGLGDTQLNLSLDSLKERQNFRLSLALAPITTQPIRKPAESLEFEVLDPLKSSTIEPPDLDTFRDSIAQLRKNESPDSHDDQQQLTCADHSSGEGTLIESSSEENATLMCEAAEPKIIDTAGTLTASSYVKNMLAEAMVEKIEAIDSGQRRAQAETTRDTSPISSESRSDLVKIGSDQTSGHTSGDELETATSSDIEIISSPNGDSSSTQSRQSPAKLQPHKGTDLLTKTLNKTRGHSRELSEISVGSDDANIEIEKLLKRIQEMSEILEARESKLVDVSRVNMELHERNESLRSQLDTIEKRAEENQELSQITDEYTQRLSALERKFQQAIRERDNLRKQMEQLKHEASARLSSQELSSIAAEKDQVIKELREEGEKLSKQQLQHSNLIKKLRSKEKESDNVIKQQKEQIEEQTLELERLKRSMHAKEEIERSQIEAVHALTAKTKRQEKELLSLQEKLDDAVHRLDTYKRSLDAAKADLTETKQHLIFAEEELKEAIENAGESSQLSSQVHDLKIKLRQAEEARVKREESLRQENSELLKRLESSEARNEALAESVSMATKPLLRQLEQLQSNLSYKTTNFLKQEKTMSETIAELQRKLDATIDTNRSLREENLTTKTRLTGLEARINAVESDKDRFEKLCEERRLENSQLEEEKKINQHILDTLEESHANQLKELKREINSLESKLSMEKAATDAEKRRNHAISDQQHHGLAEDEPRLSPTSSIGRDSIGSLSSVWPSFNDSAFETGSGRFGNVYDSVRSGVNSSTSMFENLQSQLKQRDGEVQQLQWELSRRNAERDALNSELSKLTLKVENLSSKLYEVERLNESLNDTRTQYDALLQMYGEKVEENQELRLDLEDVKEMYKSQIDQLLGREALH